MKRTLYEPNHSELNSFNAIKENDFHLQKLNCHCVNQFYFSNQQIET